MYLIKHIDSWRGSYYLRADLTFTTNRSEASRFSIKSATIDTITNLDTVTIECDSIPSIGLTVTASGTVVLSSQPSSFYITNGTDTFDAILCETPLYFFTEAQQRKSLMYEWSLIDRYHPARKPHLTIGEFAHDQPMYKFYLERADEPLLKVKEKNSFSKIQPEAYRTALIIIVLLVILIVLMTISRL
jgi:hypothetical protein